MDRNLGAVRAGTAYNDSQAYGDLFQWGRPDDLHQDRHSGTTITLSNIDKPGHSNFIYGMGSPYDWRSPQNNNLWQGVFGINNPCPLGWRIPTAGEWRTEINSWDNTIEDYQERAFASPLKLTRTGLRPYINPSYVDLYPYKNQEDYWSSTVSGSNAKNLGVYGNVNAGSLGIASNSRAFGMAVRCIKN